MHDTLIEHIRELVAISEKESELIREAFKPTQLKRKDFLLKKGELSNHMRFVVEWLI